MVLKENLPFKVTQKSLLLLFGGIVLVLVGVFLGSNNNYFSLDSQSVSENEIAQDLVSVLETQSGQDYEIVSTKEQNSLYKVDIKDQRSQLSTYYITRDGEMITGEMTDFEQLQDTVEAQTNFSNCLSNRDVVMYGNASQQATTLQIQILGGTNMVEPIYKDLNNPQVLEEAVQREVQRVPGFYYDDSVLSGVNQISQISEFSGCEY